MTIEELEAQAVNAPTNIRQLEAYRRLVEELKIERDFQAVAIERKDAEIERLKGVVRECVRFMESCREPNEQVWYAGQTFDSDLRSEALAKAKEALK